MEGDYAVYFGNQQTGKVQVQRQGLYYRFFCRCSLSGGVVCRLNMVCGGKQENLGVVVPVGEGFGLDTRIPAKRLGEGEPEFFLVPRHDRGDGTFVPLRPEEPFAYIRRLKEAYLACHEGQLGVMLPPEPGKNRETA